MAYQKSSHSIFMIHLHFVWITKYRKPVLKGDTAERAKELIMQICENEKVEILKGHVRPDHVHLFVSMPASLSASKLMQRVKGKSGYTMLKESPQLRKQYYGGHLWARGYFCCSSGNITDEMIMEYIEKQDISEDDNFQISE